MRIVFFGSPEFALPSLEALLASRHELVAVVSQPDRPAGRGHAATAPPVKLLAQSHGLPVLQPENVSAPESVEALRALGPDVFIIAAYGQILRQRLLEVPKRGILNVHASLLPRHRGASPVAAAILTGDELTGVTLMEMVLALDAGPMVARAEVEILPHDTTGTLEPRLATVGAELLSESLDAWAEGRLTATPQDESLVTYAPQLTRADALIDWSLPAVELWRRVRAFNPWPVAHTHWRGEELRVHEAWPLTHESGELPGTILPAASLPPEADDLEVTFSVATGVGSLAIRRLQRPGKRALSGAEFLRGQRDLIGQRLGASRAQ
jgi:methionyl-tRNA formyltransferase